jgi:hypothetical protein
VIHSAFVIPQIFQFLNNTWHAHHVCLYWSYMHANNLQILQCIKQSYVWFCREFMHIVLVHYLELKVTPNPSMLICCSLLVYLISGFEHSTCD